MLLENLAKSYGNLCQFLFLSYMRRRLHVDLMRYYKILFGIVETPTEDFFMPSTYVSTRGHQYKLFKKTHVSRTRADFF